MQDVYNFFYDVNKHLTGKGLEEVRRYATAGNHVGLAVGHADREHGQALETLTKNLFNGHPDLLVKGVYPDNSVKAGSEGVEIKTTRKSGGAVDTHGARDQWMCVFVYEVDTETEPAGIAQAP